MPTLTELSTTVFDLERQLDSAEGDEAQREAIAAYLESTQDAVEQKLDRYATFIRELEARADYRNQEAKRMAHLAKVDLGRADFLKDRLKNFFLSRNLVRVETPHFRLTLAQNGGRIPVVVSVPAEELPTQFQTQTVSVKPNLDALRESLEAGEAIEGVAFGEREKSVRIK